MGTVSTGRRCCLWRALYLEGSIFGGHDLWRARSLEGTIFGGHSLRRARRITHSISEFTSPEWIVPIAGAVVAGAVVAGAVVARAVVAGAVGAGARQEQRTVGGGRPSLSRAASVQLITGAAKGRSMCRMVSDGQMSCSHAVRTRVAGPRGD